ncbi:hypothetical protein M569_03442 [Genlisea aurea]|uniref:Uncharacterized protein n=1 Tax=Genlisea aurea TaxID=192259 RepID=S8CWT0_9LAMI|nr:hypothetical protein M569_03442 [Genlisea aurea]
MPTVRLGGKKKRKMPFFLARLYKRLKIRSIKSNYLQKLRKLKREVVSILTASMTAGGGAITVMDPSFGFAPPGFWLIGYT